MKSERAYLTPEMNRDGKLRNTVIINANDPRKRRSLNAPTNA